MTSRRLKVLFTTVLLFLAAPAFAAPTIYGSAWVHPSGGGSSATAPATLYSISPTTGAATPIGLIGFNNVGALAFDGNGVLYGISSSGASDVLITINTSTGVGTLVGSTGLAPAPPSNHSMADMTFRPSDGTLFAMTGGRELYTINKTTGLATLIATLVVYDGNALAFSSSNVLYSARARTPTTAFLDTLNQTTGATLTTLALIYDAAFGSSEPRANAMDFDLATGVLWASVQSGNNSTAVHSIGMIDIATGAVTRVGPTVAGLDAIAIAPTPPSLQPIPTLSEYGLMLLMLGLAVAAIFHLKRNVRT